jgi:hypothetical protein
MQARLNKWIVRDSAVFPPMRDVGLTCFQALEAKRTGRRKTRGGSLVRAAPTLTRQ